MQDLTTPTLADIDLVGSLLPAVQTPVKTGPMATASGGCGPDRRLDSLLLASMRSMDRFVWAVVRILTKRLNFAGFSLRVGFESHDVRASRRRRSMTEAAYRKARAESMVASKSFASRRFRLIQAKKRSTTQRRGWTAKPT